MNYMERLWMIKTMLWKIKGWLRCKLLGIHVWEMHGFTSLNFKGINVISGELSSPEILDTCMFCGKGKL